MNKGYDSDERQTLTKQSFDNSNLVQVLLPIPNSNGSTVLEVMVSSLYLGLWGRLVGNQAMIYSADGKLNYSNCT